MEHGNELIQSIIDANEDDLLASPDLLIKAIGLLIGAMKRSAEIAAFDEGIEYHKDHGDD